LGGSDGNRDISAWRTGGDRQGPPSPSASGSQPPAINLPKGGGAIRGIGEKFAANPVNGTASMSVPIATTAGRSGFGPQLSLSYDSGAGNGPFGLGWTVSLPSITRKTDKGLPRYCDPLDSDIFVLSGVEDLVPALAQDLSGEWVSKDQPRTVDGKTYHVRRYRPRIEGLFARIERWTNTGDAKDVFWRSISRDNVTSWYGRSAESRIADPSNPERIFSWLICQSHDDKGNVIAYGYKAEDSERILEDAAGRPVHKVHERNRSDDIRRTQRYLKHVRYGNRTPYFPALKATEEWPAPTDSRSDEDGSRAWMFEAVFDYGDHDPDAPVPKGTGAWPARLDPFSTYRAGFEVRTYRLCRRVLMFHHFAGEAGVERNCLVRSTDFNYSDAVTPIDARNAVYTFLTSVTQTGYRRSNGGYDRRSLPAVEFKYSEPVVQDTIEEIDSTSLENLPAGLDGKAHRWTDLHGEGLPGILVEQDGAWLFKDNLSPLANAARFAPLQALALKPNAALGAGAEFMDLAGDGQPDVVVMTGPAPGLYEHDEVAGWHPFRPFTARLNVEFGDPNLKFVDLNGDGRADVLVTEEDAFVWHASLGEQGFGPSNRVAQAPDEEKGPRLVFSDGTQSIFLADMSGDGLTDLVRIRNGEVCYWPSLGYCRFGAKVTMAFVDENGHGSHFDQCDGFDHRRIRLADIDGSGTTDIIYLHRDGVRLYFNQSGNGWSQPRQLKAFPRIDDLASIIPIDLLGNGTACLVWSSPLPGEARRPMRYVDLMGGLKPHLMIRTVNNLGAETRIDYAPSTRFYLHDKHRGLPWITRLPFPVHVVERVETLDHIGRSRFVTRFAYHHGYFDGEEREFRGFGMVEQWDTEQMTALADGTLPAENIDSTSHVPPVHTRTWFHTGAYVGRGQVSSHFEREYFREPGLTLDAAHPFLLEDCLIPPGLTLDEEREAARALKGSMLRQEVYALDGVAQSTEFPSGMPYSVIEQNLAVRIVQPRGASRHAVFFTHARETLTHHYERNPADPRVQHALTLKVDRYGNVLEQAAIGYGRRTSPLAEPWDRTRQISALMTFGEASFSNAVDDPEEYPDAYRGPQPVESSSYELTGIASGAERLSLEQVSVGANAASPLLYEETPVPGQKQKRLIERVRTLYRKDDLTGLLPLGEVGPLALPAATYKLAFTPGLLDLVFKRPREGQADEPLLPEVARASVLGGQAGNQGGYVDLDGDGCWWIPSARSFLSSDPDDEPAAELAAARAHFFLARRYRDPFGHDAFVDFDAHDLLPVETRDAIGNRVAVNANDYRVLKPRLVSDPNGNRTEVVYDALGMVAGSAVMGKPEPAQPEGDSLDGLVPDPGQDELDDFFNAVDPNEGVADLLKGATTRIVYDLHRFRRTRLANPKKPETWLPPCAATLGRVTHLHAELPAKGLRTLLSFSYSDGFGREIQTKVQAEPGPVPRRDAAGGILTGPTGQPLMTAGDASRRWVGSGWTLLNNKGKPVRQFEPFFTDSHHFEHDVRIGVSSVLFYDAAERVIATLHPNHSYEKVVFDSWQQTSWDVNDTCAPRNLQTGDPRTDPDISGHVAAYFAARPADPMNPWQTWHDQRIGGALGSDEQTAAERAAAHADTPTTVHFDTLGQPFLTVSRNRVDCNGHPLDGIPEEAVRTRTEWDIEGNQRTVFDERRLPDTAGLPLGDAEQRIVMQYAYDMAGNRIHQLSMEAGGRWLLNDVAGKPIRTWDSRGHDLATRYDVLRRPVGYFARGTLSASDPLKPRSDLRTLGRDILVERVEYGESVANAETLNLRTRPFRHFDSAGVATYARLDPAGNPIEAYDFKGNLLGSTRRLTRDYKAIPDWLLPAAAQLESESFESRVRYDALNRPIQSVAPHSSRIRPEHPDRINIVQPVFNEANLIERIDVWLERTTKPDSLLDPEKEAPSPVGVANVDYDAKGQRLRIDYKNGASIFHEHDPLTFRLARLQTVRSPGAFPGDDPQPPLAGWPGKQVQDLRYTYDPAGNITHVQDDAQQTIFFRNKRVEPAGDYVYDALYRLVQAEGREHLGQAGGSPFPHSHDDAGRVGLESADAAGRFAASDGNAMGTFTERYVYDAVGNFLQMQHRGHEPGNAGWTRVYGYAEASLIEPGKQSNRLSRTNVANGIAGVPEPYLHDVHGNMLRMPHLGNSQAPNLHWDYRDRLCQVDKGGGGTAYFVSDASGRRVRKVWEKSAGLTEERIYLGGFEIFRSHGGAIGTAPVTLERETVQVRDDKNVVALVETLTLDTAGSDRAPGQLIRYQFGNHLGSASLELDDDARIISYEEYSPFGSSTYQAVRRRTETAKRYRYTGRERDEESGFYYNEARYYAAWLGRWTASDPLGLVDGTNLYRYARNQPVVLSDPQGTDPPRANTGDSTDPLNFVDVESYRAANPSQPADVVDQVWRDAHPEHPATPPDPEVVSPPNPGPAMKAIARSRELQPFTPPGPTSEGRFRVSGIRTPDPDTTLTPRAKYLNPVAAEAAANGFVHWAELVEAGHGCSACHVTHNLGRIPTDAEFDLNRYNTVAYSMYTARAFLEFGLAVGGARVAWGAGRGGSPPVGGGDGGGTGGGGSSRRVYIPRDADGNPVPLASQRVNGTDIPLPDPTAQGPHTVLGGRVGSDGVVYRQSASFPEGVWPTANGQNVPWSRVDWHDHSRPWDHTNPHQHPFLYDSSRGGWTELPRTPFYPASGN